METLRIAQLQADGTWENNDGETMFKSEVLLSDGKTGFINAKSENRWKEGDEVEVTREKEDKKGNTLLSLSKPKSQWENKVGAPKQNPEERKKHDLLVGTQWAINASIRFIEVSKAEDVSLASVAHFSKALIRMRGEIVEWAESLDS